MTTGYSRAAVGEKDEPFHGVQGDIESVGDFIRLYTTRYKRWSSPKFLAGESYGTTRAAGLSGYLQERFGMYLSGISLISTVLNFQTIAFDPGNDLPYPLFLPTYTATAWYHKKLAPELQTDLRKSLEESEKFAAGDYVRALMKGSALAGAERQEVSRELSRLTGLPEKYVDESNLRVPIGRFVKELMRDERRTVGRLDTRFEGPDTDVPGQWTGDDPSYAAIYGTYTASLNDYVRSELGYENDLPYEILTDRVRPWDYGDARNRYLNVTAALQSALQDNPYLHVFLAAGYYDLATPYFAAEYTLKHLAMDPGMQKNLTVAHYEAGHMMYIHKPSLEKLSSDEAAFYRETLGRR